MIILGIDPGLRNTGWGVVHSQGNNLRHVAHGAIVSKTRDTLPKRLACLYDGLQQVIGEYQPLEVAIERVFVNKNPNSTLLLGQARGAALLAPAQHDIPVSEYSPNRIKKALVGAGHAKKEQVAHMVRRLLVLPSDEGDCSDAFDALAVAITHAHFRQSQNRIRSREFADVR